MPVYSNQLCQRYLWGCHGHITRECLHCCRSNAVRSAFCYCLLL